MFNPTIRRLQVMSPVNSWNAEPVKECYVCYAPDDGCDRCYVCYGPEYEEETPL